MISPSTYLEGIVEEIDRAKKNGRNGVYRINSKVSDEIALYVEAYVKNMYGYRTEFRKCHSCLNTWDIIIFF